MNYKIAKKGVQIMLINGKDLYQFSTYIPQINLSFNQYMLLAEEPILIHTGNMKQAQQLNGFGFMDEIIIKRAVDKLIAKDIVATGHGPCLNV